MKFSELITDPSSGQGSMSRLCFGLLVAALVALVAVSLPLKIPVKEAGGLLVTALGITAGLYGANSVAGAWNRSRTRGCTSYDPIISRQPIEPWNNPNNDPGFYQGPMKPRPPEPPGGAVG